MTTVTIKDIPVTQELPEHAARKIVGGMINQRDIDTAPLPGEPSGGAGTTDLIIHYTLTVIE